MPKTELAAIDTETRGGQLKSAVGLVARGSLNGSLQVLQCCRKPRRLSRERTCYFWFECNSKCFHPDTLHDQYTSSPLCPQRFVQLAAPGVLSGPQTNAFRMITTK